MSLLGIFSRTPSPTASPKSVTIRPTDLKTLHTEVFEAFHENGDRYHSAKHSGDMAEALRASGKTNQFPVKALAATFVEHPERYAEDYYSDRLDDCFAPELNAALPRTFQSLFIKALDVYTNGRSPVKQLAYLIATTDKNESEATHQKLVNSYKQEIIKHLPTREAQWVIGAAEQIAYFLKPPTFLSDKITASNIARWMFNNTIADPYFALRFSEIGPRKFNAIPAEAKDYTLNQVGEETIAQSPWGVLFKQNA